MGLKLIESPPGRSGSVSLLAFDPALGEVVAPERLKMARRALRVEVTELPPGRWAVNPEEPDRCLGYVIGDGLLTREVRLMGSRSVEPLGPGDLLRPWQEEAVSFVSAELTALTPARIALLDQALLARAAHFPGIIEALFDRATQRSRYMSVYGAIDALVGVHRRLHALMWTLAERWGAFQNGEVFLPVELHHDTLAGLVAARRPSVSSALSRLQREGRLERVNGGWILHGDPPSFDD